MCEKTVFALHCTTGEEIKIYICNICFQCCSVSKVVQAEMNRDGMLLTLEVQTKIPVATET